jgi:RNA-binding protein
MAKKLKLNSKDKAYLKGLGHHIKAFLQIGKDGISEAFISNLEAELEHHELIKIKILDNAPGDKKSFSLPIEKAVNCSVVGLIGKTLLLYKPFKEEPQIKLPRSASEAKKIRQTQ